MMLEVDNALGQMQKSVTSEFLVILNRLKGTESKKAAEIIIGDFKGLADTLENDFRNLNEQCGKMFASQSGGVSDLVLDYHAKVCPLTGYYLARLISRCAKPWKLKQPESTRRMQRFSDVSF